MFQPLENNENQEEEEEEEENGEGSARFEVNTSLAVRRQSLSHTTSTIHTALMVHDEFELHDVSNNILLEVSKTSLNKYNDVISFNKLEQQINT